MSQWTDEVQQLRVQAYSGSFTLSFGGQATDPLPFDSDSLAIETALNVLPALREAGVRVDGSGPFTVRFVGVHVAESPQPLIGVDGSGLAGGLANLQGYCSDSTFERPSPWFSVGLQGYSGGSVFAIQSNSGAPSAAWVVQGVAPGLRYRVWVNWLADQANREPNTTYVVRNGATASSPVLATATVNQRNDPAGTTFTRPASGGANRTFQALGVVTPTGTALRVEVGYPDVGGSGQAIVADAVVLEALDPTPVVATCTRLQAGTAATSRGSLKFAGGAYVRASNRYATDIWRGSTLARGQSKASVALWARMDALQGGWPNLFLWGRYHVPFQVKYQSGNLVVIADYHPVTSPDTGRQLAIWVPLGLGDSHHWLAVFDGSIAADGATLTLYRDGEVIGSAPCDPLDVGVEKRLGYGTEYDSVFVGPSPAIAGYPTTADVTLGDVALWGGYAASAQDAADLTALLKRPVDIAPDHVFFSFSGAGGTLGQAVQPWDVGATNRGLPDYDVPAFTAPDPNNGWRDASTIGSGSLTYGSPLVYVPPVVVSEAMVIVGPHSPKGSVVALTFRTRGGSPAPVPRTIGAAALTRPGKRVTLHVRREGTSVDEVHELTDVVWETSNSDRDGVVFVFPVGVPPIGPGDVARVTAPAKWVYLADGYCDAVDLPVTYGSPIARWLNEPTRTMLVGYNIHISSQSGIPLFGNMAKSIIWWYGWPPIDDATGEPRLASGQSAETFLLANGPTNTIDPHVAREPRNRNAPNPYYDNPDQGTAGFRMGYGYKAVPRKGTIEVVWDYLPGRTGDGEVSVHPNWGEPTDPQFRVWGGEPGIQPGVNGLNYRKSYHYECFDPAVNPDDPSGSVLAPALALGIAGGVTNWRVTFQADPSLPEAVWNTDPINPDAFHPYLVHEVLRGAKTLRFLDPTGSNGMSNSRYEHWTTPEYTTWSGESRDRADMYVPVVRLVPFGAQEREAVLRRFPHWGQGGAFFRVVCGSPHGLDNGSVCHMTSNSGPVPTNVFAADGGRIRLDYFLLCASVLSPTELAVWAETDNRVEKVTQDLARVHEHEELGGLIIQHNRTRTFPLRHMAELCNAVGADLHFNVPHAFVAAVSDLLPDGTDHPSTTALRRTFAELANHLGPGRKLYVEYSNEVWNGGMPFVYHMFHQINQGGGLSGHGASLTVTALDANGGIKTVAVGNPGTGYFTGRVYFQGGAGQGAEGFLKCDPHTGHVTGVWVKTPGAGYGPPNAVNPPVVVTIGGGTGAVLQVAGIANGAITGVNVISGGTGYQPNVLTFEGGHGVGAWATFAVNGSGTIQSVTMGSGGTGYQPADAVDVRIFHSFTPGLSLGSWPEGIKIYALMASKRVARIAREEFMRVGRPLTDVLALVNVGPAAYLGEITETLVGHGLQADPMTRINEYSGNSYWFGLNGDGWFSPDLIERLTTDQEFDIGEWLMADPRILSSLPDIRAYLDGQGLADVAVTSYEGGLSQTPVNPLSEIAYPAQPDPTVMATEVKRSMRTIGYTRHPRLYRLTLASFGRLQEIGLTRYQRFLANFFYFSRAFPPNMADHWLWGDYTSFGQLAGRGDGTDGKWDNRVTVENPLAAFREGHSVSPQAAALKDWAAATGATPPPNQPPTLTVPSSTLVGVVGRVINFRATADDPDFGQTLTFSLGPGAPPGASIDAQSGLFAWIPTQLGIVTVTVQVRDNGAPSLSVTATVTINVTTVPQPRPRFVPRITRTPRYR